MTLIASRLVISESLLFVFELYRDIRHICTSFVSYTILRSDLQLSLCRSLDQFLHYEVVMVLLTAFERFLHPLSRDSLIIIAHQLSLVKHFSLLF